MLEVDDGQLVMVTWRDAWFEFDASDKPRKDYLVHTVGWVKGQNKRFLSIGGEQLPKADGYRAVTHVPVVCIEEVTPLQPLTV